MSESVDRLHMRRALELARAQLGRTGENPAVGCVIAAGERALGEGATGDGGRPHAEEIALAAAGASAHGATAYVTLEPCGLRSSGAASCARRLAQAGVARVVVAARDASVFADGRGPAELAAAGVSIEWGLLADEAARLYESYRPASG